MLDRSSGILNTNAQFGEAVKMDLLSEILRVVKLKGALFFNAEFSAPWCFSSSRSNPHFFLKDPCLKNLRQLPGF
jgi:hypothetical protein